LTSLECLEHPYLLESVDRTRTDISPAISVSTSLSGHSTRLSAPVPPFLNSRVCRVMPNGASLSYLLTLQVSLKHRLHADNRSSHFSIRQTLIMRISLVPNLITPLLCNTQQWNHLCHRTQVQSCRQTCRMTGRACRRPRSLMFPTSIVSLWTQLCLLRLKNSQLYLQPSLILHNGVPYDVSAPAPKLHKAPSSNF